MDRKIPYLYQIVRKKIEENVTINNTLSYRDFNRIMSWAIHLSKRDSRIILQELKNMKMVKLGNRGLKLIEVDENV